MNKGYIVNLTTSRQPTGYDVCILPEMNATTSDEAISVAISQVCLVEDCDVDDCEVNGVEVFE